VSGVATSPSNRSDPSGPAAAGVPTKAAEEPEAWLGLGLEALREGQPALAVQWLSRAQQHAPGNASIWVTLGVAHKQLGARQAAIQAYREALACDPRCASAWLNLARALREEGERGASLSAFRKAVEFGPKEAAAWSMLSNALREADQLDAALRAARQALALDPFFGEAHLNEGVALHLAGDLDAASASYFVATTLPGNPQAAHSNLRVLLAAAHSASSAPTSALGLVRRLCEANADANLIVQLGRLLASRQRVATALACSERVAALRRSASAYRELAVQLWGLGHQRPALARLLAAIACEASDVASYRLAGNWLCLLGTFEELGAEWEPVFASCPDDVFALVNLGVAAQRRGRPSEAARLHRRALALNPKQVEALLNLGAALSDQGQFAESAALYRRALELDPQRWGVFSNLLFAMHFDPEQNPEAIFAEHQRFGQRISAALPPRARDFQRRRDPLRRLRLGYISPDLRQHPVAYFLEPVLRQHDPSSFEIHCYSDTSLRDDVTERLAQCAPHFTHCSDWSDDKLEQQLVEDQIDILVDLAGHTGHNRLPVFARRPSPVQVAWLGYFDTTGLPSIDYRLIDPHSLAAEAESWFSEELVRLPRSCNCFLPPTGPEPAPSPALQSGQVTFGCFNNPSKITRQVVAVFGRILRQVPGSRLFLKYGAFADPALGARYLAWLAEEQIAKERVEISGHSSMLRFLESFSRVDIALDPFPYSGETTALHTLWMGVPLVTLDGVTLAQRLASRVLRVAGLTDWIAGSQDQYVAIAGSLASDLGALGRQRQTLRPQLQASALFDTAGVTRELEATYRALWQRWCERA
jgi:protein O-GlcNAc transferase